MGFLYNRITIQSMVSIPPYWAVNAQVVLNRTLPNK